MFFFQKAAGGCETAEGACEVHLGAAIPKPFLRVVGLVRCAGYSAESLMLSRRAALRLNGSGTAVIPRLPEDGRFLY